MIKADRIWLDGKLVAFEDAKVHVLTHALHYGIGVFEGIRAYEQAGGGSAVFRLREHIQRLFDSARIMLMDLPFAPGDVERACVDVLKANGLKAGYIRPLAFFGTGSMGVGAPNPVQVLVAAWPWGAYLSEEGMAKGIRAKVSSIARLHIGGQMVRAKVSGQYVNSFLATREAALAGYDEAILLDADGYVAEGSGENVFIVKNGVLQTPPLSSPVLDGITRNAVLRLAADLGIPVKEEKFTRDTAYLADELFLTGTAAEVTPVRELDNRRIGKGEPGPVTKRISEAFFKAVGGEDPKHREWLTPY
ncbi:branched-chain amino acid aminotransferase [Anaeromyxobacter dehalogenans 2CP-1]|uniref:Branched-chain-amino-acid aminotransferase n=1 Tax=Anaeromyxobacter dehalogenans (strain ATCC BAA-258 / DSM 21875 / 2CP-1) TaxID=455488 RepID=B8JFT6_ANAD2|nr:branched-chain amino acid transaminase [Anaeromyxobacter dehalogenans]ACL64524.1 branched-chain amino acid aminotransferase [Anaeromyxobacter dehalogenans 2CP-1]